MDLEKLPIQLALEMGRKLQSPQTGFIHLFSEDSQEKMRDTIFVAYNFLFALALIRSRITEQALEGIELLKKLMPFQVEGRWPRFLHEYPYTKPSNIIIGVTRDLLKHYPTILGNGLIKDLEKVNLEGEEETYPETLIEWGKWLLYHPIDEKACSHYCPTLGVFLGKAAMLAQDEDHPQVHLFNLIMGIYHGQVFPPCLKESPYHLLAALVRTLPEKLEPRLTSLIVEQNPTPKTSFRILWKEDEQITSIEGVGPGIFNDLTWIIPLTGELEEERKERIEASIYFSLSDSAHYSVNGGKASLFWAGEEFAFFTKKHRVTLSFSIIEGEGKFSAHIQLGNRPNQISADQGKAYDLKIGFRTIERSNDAKLQVKLGLSTATPIACIPLST